MTFETRQFGQDVVENLRTASARPPIGTTMRRADGGSAKRDECKDDFNTI